MAYERMLNGNVKPTGDEIVKTIGKKSSLWEEIRHYLEDSYDFKPEFVFYGRKYGWTVRFRKSGKTLCSLFPEEDAFTVLIVLGNKEVERIYSIIDDINSKIREFFDNAEQLREGRWLWIRVTKKNDIESIKLLLSAKRKPKKSLTGN